MPVIIRSHNKQLRKAYFTALSGIVVNGNTIPVYSEMAPDSPPDAYIVFASVANVENSLKATPILDSSMSVIIYSNGTKYSNANTVDDIASEVLQRITAGLIVEGACNAITEVVNDNTQNWRSLNQIVAIDRMITFRHKITQ